jgi:hypothetical protein
LNGLSSASSVRSGQSHRRRSAPLLEWRAVVPYGAQRGFGSVFERSGTAPARSGYGTEGFPRSTGGRRRPAKASGSVADHDVLEDAAQKLGPVDDAGVVGPLSRDSDTRLGFDSLRALRNSSKHRWREARARCNSLRLSEGAPRTRSRWWRAVSAATCNIRVLQALHGPRATRCTMTSLPYGRVGSQTTDTAALVSPSRVHEVAGAAEKMRSRSGQRSSW